MILVSHLHLWKSVRSRKCVITFMLLFLVSTFVQAKLVDARLPNKIITTAEFITGNSEKSAIFLLHGFLQTHHSSTLSRLLNHVSSEGYTVLAPTLSLGVSHRKQSLSCDAIHTHNMNGDIDEIKFWIAWLTNKGYKEIIVIGHSYGSLQLMVYMSKYSNKAIKKIIVTSLVDFDHLLRASDSEEQLNLAKKMLLNNDHSLSKYRISYCNKYISPPSSYLSYAEWSKLDILNLAKSLDVPLDIIIGSNDKRVNEQWPNMLKSTGAQVVLVDGANHFFDAEFEFDLLDIVSNLLDSYHGKK